MVTVLEALAKGNALPEDLAAAERNYEAKGAELQKFLTSVVSAPRDPVLELVPGFVSAYGERKVQLDRKITALKKRLEKANPDPKTSFHLLTV